MRRWLPFLPLVGCRADLPDLKDAHRDLTHSLAVIPGAESFGTETPAGRGGKVLRVTSRAEDGPGSLRAAIETTGPRVIVFETSGVIPLTRDLKLTEPFVTVAGQTAP